MRADQRDRRHRRDPGAIQEPPARRDPTGGACSSWRSAFEKVGRAARRRPTTSSRTLKSDDVRRRPEGGDDARRRWASWQRRDGLADSIGSLALPRIREMTAALLEMNKAMSGGEGDMVRAGTGVVAEKMRDNIVNNFADGVDRQSVRRRLQQVKPGPWPARERRPVQRVRPGPGHDLRGGPRQQSGCCCCLGFIVLLAVPSWTRPPSRGPHCSMCPRARPSPGHGQVALPPGVAYALPDYSPIRQASSSPTTAADARRPGWRAMQWNFLSAKASTPRTRGRTRTTRRRAGEG